MTTSGPSAQSRSGGGALPAPVVDYAPSSVHLHQRASGIPSTASLPSTPHGTWPPAHVEPPRPRIPDRRVWSPLSLPRQQPRPPPPARPSQSGGGCIGSAFLTQPAHDHQQPSSRPVMHLQHHSQHNFTIASGSDALPAGHPAVATTSLSAPAACKAKFDKASRPPPCGAPVSDLPPVRRFEGPLTIPTAATAEISPFQCAPSPMSHGLMPARSSAENRAFAHAAPAFPTPTAAGHARRAAQPPFQQLPLRNPLGLLPGRENRPPPNRNESAPNASFNSQGADCGQRFIHLSQIQRDPMPPSGVRHPNFCSEAQSALDKLRHSARLIGSPRADSDVKELPPIPHGHGAKVSVPPARTNFHRRADAVSPCSRGEEAKPQRQKIEEGQGGDRDIKTEVTDDNRCTTPADDAGAAASISQDQGSPAADAPAMQPPAGSEASTPAAADEGDSWSAGSPICASKAASSSGSTTPLRGDRRLGRPKIDRSTTKCCDCDAVKTPQWRYLALNDLGDIQVPLRRLSSLASFPANVKFCLCNACWLRVHKARRRAEKSSAARAAALPRSSGKSESNASGIREKHFAAARHGSSSSCLKGEGEVFASQAPSIINSNATSAGPPSLVSANGRKKLRTVVPTSLAVNACQKQLVLDSPWTLLEGAPRSTNTAPPAVDVKNSVAGSGCAMPVLKRPMVTTLSALQDNNSQLKQRRVEGFETHSRSGVSMGKDTATNGNGQRNNELPNSVGLQDALQLLSSLINSNSDSLSVEEIPSSRQRNNGGPSPNGLADGIATGGAVDSPAVSELLLEFLQKHNASQKTFGAGNAAVWPNREVNNNGHNDATSHTGHQGGMDAGGSRFKSGGATEKPSSENDRQQWLALGGCLRLALGHGECGSSGSADYDSSQQLLPPSQLKVDGTTAALGAASAAAGGLSTVGGGSRPDRANNTAQELDSKYQKSVNPCEICYSAVPHGASSYHFDPHDPKLARLLLDVAAEGGRYGAVAEDCLNGARKRAASALRQQQQPGYSPEAVNEVVALQLLLSMAGQADGGSSGLAPQQCENFRISAEEQHSPLGSGQGQMSEQPVPDPLSLARERNGKSSGSAKNTISADGSDVGNLLDGLCAALAGNLGEAAC